MKLTDYEVCVEEGNLRDPFVGLVCFFCGFEVSR